jgi:hypothetical protein
MTTASITYIGTKKLSAGHFEVNVYGNRKFLGSFETNDSMLVDDISELENGVESDLMWFESFEELKQYCLNKLNQ